jgi:predicted alpha/beta hydrolase family esterase
MHKTVLIGYRWDGRDDERWLFWLTKKLEAIGFHVQMQELPELSSNIEHWLPELENTYQIPPENVHIVQHDPGCLTILSYLERLAKKEIAEPTILVAGKPMANKGQFSINAIDNSAQKRLGTKGHSPTQKLDVALVVIYGGLISDASQKTLPKKQSWLTLE